MRSVLGLAAVALIVLIVASPSRGQDEEPVEPPPSKGVLPHESIGMLLEKMDILQGQGILGKIQHTRLRGSLSKAQQALFQANPEEANVNLDDFRDNWEDLVEEDVVTPKLATEVLDLVVGAEEEKFNLTQALAAAPFPGEFVCRPQSLSLSVPSHVDDDADKGGDGSLLKPFNTLAAAFANFPSGFQPVKIFLHPGRYEGHFSITRHTWIVGLPEDEERPVLAGSLENRGPFSLHIENLKIIDLGSGLTGGIVVNNPCASTYLREVLVEGMVGLAVIQRGGFFQAQGLTVDGTRPLSPTFSVALQLGGGVQAQLERVRLVRNHGGGLLVRGDPIGPPTHVFARRLTIRDTEANFLALGSPLAGTNPGTSGLDVRDGAVFEGQWVVLQDNEYVGVLVHRGGVANFLYTLVGPTHEIPCCEFPEAPFGHGVAAVLKGAVEMTGFVVTTAEACGVILAREGQVDLHDGVIANNSIGICLQVPGYALSRLLDNVAFVGNRPGPDIDNSTGFSAPVPMEAVGLTP